MHTMPARLSGTISARQRALGQWLVPRHSATTTTTIDFGALYLILSSYCWYMDDSTSFHSQWCYNCTFSVCVLWIVYYKLCLGLVIIVSRILLFAIQEPLNPLHKGLQEQTWVMLTKCENDYKRKSPKKGIAGQWPPKDILLAKTLGQIISWKLHLLKAHS